MNCESVMTKSPSCCLPGDSVSAAARIMKQEDVGPVLIVADHSSMRLVGIVTDRDIALGVVAEGQDPFGTRVESIMTSDPVTCRKDEDVMDAVKRMADYQVRRIPVVDEGNCVIGIISQADIARNAQEEHVGEMVEEISQPWGLGEWNEGRYESSEDSRDRSGGLDSVSAVAIGALCVGFGAGLMYLFDPSRGRKRRALLADKGAEFWEEKSEMVQRTKDAVSDKAHSLVSATRSKLGNEPKEPWQGESQTGEHPSPGYIQR